VESPKKTSSKFSFSPYKCVYTTFVNNNHRGFSLVLILFIAAVVAFGAWYFVNSKGLQDDASQAAQQEAILNAPAENKQVEQEIAESLTLPLSLRITNLEGATRDMTFTSDNYQLIEVARTPSKVLLCPSTRYGDTDGCRILIVDVAAKTAIELGFPDYAPDRSLLGSPDKKHLLFATEGRVLVIDIDTLTYRTVLTSPEGMVPGTYGCFPTFVPAVSWAGNSAITVPLYDQDQACDEKSAPKETKTVAI
jgi:hypothetical protein